MRARTQLIVERSRAEPWLGIEIRHFAALEALATERSFYSRTRSVSRAKDQDSLLPRLTTQDGAFMEPRGCNRWATARQSEKGRKRPNQAKTVALGCDRLPKGAQSREGNAGTRAQPAQTLGRLRKQPTRRPDSMIARRGCRVARGQNDRGPIVGWRRADISRTSQPRVPLPPGCSSITVGAGQTAIPPHPISRRRSSITVGGCLR
jgi:hypothetical protein